MISISSDERRDDAGVFAKEVKATFVVLHDPKTAIYGKFGVEAQPTNIIVGRNGKVTKVVEGADVPALEAAVAAALNPRAAQR